MGKAGGSAGRAVEKGLPIEAEKSEQLAARWVAAQRTVTAFLGTVLPRGDDVEEVLQRVAVTLVRKFDEYDPSLPFAAWAVGIAKFEAKAFRRQQVTAKVRVIDDDLLDRVAVSYQRLTTEHVPVRDALEECVKKLDERSRRLVELRYGDELKPAGIARSLGVSSGAVRTALSKLRLALRDCVERRMHLHGQVT